MRAIWNNQLISESDDTVKVEGNHYFPSTSINKEYYKKSETRTTCPWKGEANYYSPEVMEKKIQPHRGIILRQASLRKTSKGMWPFGRVWKLRISV